MYAASEALKPREPPEKQNSPAEEIYIEASRGLGRWLKQQNCCVLVSAYQSGRLLLIGSNEADEVTLSSIRLDRCMGLAASSQGFWLASLHQIWHFVVARLSKADDAGRETALVPQQAIHTGFINAHDLMIDTNGTPSVASSFFNCLMRIDPVSGLNPIWSPPFIGEFAAEDRCHFNGIAHVDGVPVFATALAEGNTSGSWRDNPNTGCLLDVHTGSIVVGGLSAPHSPRIHNKRLWLHESGRGSFGYMTGSHFREVLGCPGYPRGLSFKDNLAIIGLSRLREQGSGLNLPLVARLAKSHQPSVCGLLFVDIKTGDVRHRVRFGQPIEEIYDVAVVPGTSNARIVQPNSNEVLKSYVFAHLKISAEKTGASTRLEARGLGLLPVSRTLG